jgi:hypothetical protein
MKFVKIFGNLVRRQIKQMTERRNLKKELQYFVYNDPEYGEDIENISYPALILILQDLVERMEKLEQRLDKQEEYQQEQNES